MPNFFCHGSCDFWQDRYTFDLYALGQYIERGIPSSLDAPNSSNSLSKGALGTSISIIERSVFKGVPDSALTSEISIIEGLTGIPREYVNTQTHHTI